jgi:chemotaxis protein CheX
VDARFVNPFIESFQSVMPQLGFSDVKIGKLSAKSKEVTGNGVVIVIGFLGDIKGNIVFRMQMEHAMAIASTMMAGMQVEEFDEIAESALAELANMLTANSATCLYEKGLKIDISTPTMLEGENMSVKMNTEKILCVELLADGIPIEVNLAFEE